jgi:hypothetical protein
LQLLRDVSMRISLQGAPAAGKSRVAAGYKMMAVVNGGVSGQVVITLAIGPGVDGTEFDAPNGDVFNVCGKAESVLPR